MSLQIEIVTGSAADRLLAEDNFISQWETLYAACPWGPVSLARGTRSIDRYSSRFWFWVMMRIGNLSDFWQPDMRHGAGW